MAKQQQQTGRIPAPAPASATPQKQYTTKCVYFPDRALVEELERLLARYPKATLSTLFAQLIDPAIKAIKDLPEGQRQVHLNMRIWI